MWRIIWQYSGQAIGPPTALPRPTEWMVAASSRHFSGVALDGLPEPVFPGHPTIIRSAVLAQYRPETLQPALDLTGYYHAFARDEESAVRAVMRLQSDPAVRYADVQPPWSPPVRFSAQRRPSAELAVEALPAGASPNLIAEQAYLGAAPTGIDATFAWTKAGGKGAGTNVIDVESGWNLRHEDLLNKHGGVVFGPNADSDHGTAVLGIFSANVISVGVTGIACETFASAASANWDATGAKWNAAAAIYAAAERLSAGDIILLEMHAPGPNSPGLNEGQLGYIAIEYWDSEFAAISFATQKGIYVVEAAGNGSETLDAAPYQHRFDRGARDSGAILVGGGESSYGQNPRARISWSNYGSRLDVQGWGESIVTCGGLSQPNYCDRFKGMDESHCYTETFGGTSGASPIVVGAVACLAGGVRAAGRQPLSPAEMRRTLTDTGTMQADAPDRPATQRIGPLPNLRAAFASLGL